MPFLAINGITVPVAYGNASRTPQHIGKFSRAVSGDASRGTRTRKSQWQFTTNPMTSEEATALIGMVMGDGQHFPFDANAYSSSGLAADTETNPTYVSNTAADGRGVQFVSAAPATYKTPAIRTGALASYDATTNILHADARDAENGDPPAQFSALSTATLSASTSYYWQGTQSLKCVCGNAGNVEGFDTAAAACSSSTEYTASGYMISDSGDAAITFVVITDTGTVGSAAFTIPDDKWTRVDYTGTTNGTAATIKIRVQEQNAADNITIYGDGFQIEEQPWATPWVDGSRAADTILKYPISILSAAESFTIAFWNNGSESSNAAAGNATLVDLQETSAKNRMSMYWWGGGHTIIVLSFDKEGNSNNTSMVAAGPSIYDWHHYAITYDQPTKTISLLRDGVVDNTDTNVADFDFSSVPDIDIGNVTSTPLTGQIDDLLLLPYALSTAQVLDLYNGGTAPAIKLPRIIASGDFIRQSSVECYGEVTGVKYQGVDRGAGAGWENDAQVLTIRLREV